MYEKIGQVVTFVEILCFELIGFKKNVVKYFVCGICSHTVVIFNALVFVQCVNISGRELQTGCS